MVTHDPHAAERASRILHLEKGDLAEHKMRVLKLIFKMPFGISSEQF